MPLLMKKLIYIAFVLMGVLLLDSCSKEEIHICNDMDPFALDNGANDARTLGQGPGPDISVVVIIDPDEGDEDLDADDDSRIVDPDEDDEDMDEDDDGIIVDRPSGNDGGNIGN